MKIVEGPNLNGWLAIAFIIFLCFAKQSFTPLLIAFAVLSLLVPACLWLHQANERAGTKMLKDFPDDPYIQKKYGKYKQPH